jgi:hypothetical protein
MTATAQQNTIETLTDQIQKGEITTSDANVRLVLSQRFRLIRNTVPKQVRAALNSAVKAGQLKHMKKDGHRPEVYYHPNFEYMAIAARNEAHTAVMRFCQVATARIGVEIADQEI